jgi:hypothetical protein
VQDIYQRILKIVDAPEFHGYGWKLQEIRDSGDRTSSDLIAYMWPSDTAIKLVVVNLSSGTATGRIYFSDDLLSGASLKFDDLLNQQTYERQTADLKRWGLFIKLEAFGAHIFDVKKG